MNKKSKTLFLNLLACFLIVWGSFTQVDRALCQSRSSDEKIMDVAGIIPGMIIGEIGAGEGDLAAAMAARVGAKGKVYANEIDRQMLDIIDKKGSKNVETVLGQTDDPLFPVDNLDLVIMQLVFHDLEYPLSMLENIKKYLKENAPIVIFDTDHLRDSKDLRIQWHSMTKDQVLDIVKKSSFKLVHLDTSLPSNNIYVLRVDKNKESLVWPTWFSEFRSEVDKVERNEKKEEISIVKKRIAWERVLNSFRDNCPTSEEDEQMRKRINEKINSLKKQEKRPDSAYKSAINIQKPSDFSGIHLRSEYRAIGENDISTIFARLGFRGILNVRKGDFPNKYKPLSIYGDKIVLDNASGLIWHQSGSKKTMDYFDTLEWIDDLNIRGYAGCSEWRLPTVEEILSLFETQKTENDMHIDPLFSDEQIAVWTGDTIYSGRLWTGSFKRAGVTVNLKTFKYWVRPVCSMK